MRAILFTSLRMPSVRVLRTCGFRRKVGPSLSPPKQTEFPQTCPKLCSRSTRASLSTCQTPGSAGCYESAWTYGCRFLSQRSRAKHSPVSRCSAWHVAALSAFPSDLYVFRRSEATFNQRSEATVFPAFRSDALTAYKGNCTWGERLPSSRL